MLVNNWWLNHFYITSGNIKYYSCYGSLAVAYVTNNAITILPSKCILGHSSQINGNLCSHKHLCMNVQSSFVFNNQKQETSHKSLSRWIFIQAAEHPYHGVLLSNTKEQTTDMCKSLDKSLGNYMKWKKKKSTSKVYVLFDSTYKRLMTPFVKSTFFVVRSWRWKRCRREVDDFIKGKLKKHCGDGTVNILTIMMNTLYRTTHTHLVYK